MSNKKHKKHSKNQSGQQNNSKTVQAEVQAVEQKDAHQIVPQSEQKENENRKQQSEQKVVEKLHQQPEQKAEEKPKQPTEEKAGEKPQHQIEQKVGEKSHQQPEQKVGEKSHQQTEQKVGEKSHQQTEQKTDEKSKLQAQQKVEKEMPKKHEQKGKKPWILALVIVLIVILALIAAALLWYGKKVDYYQDRYLQNTSINGMDCSEMTPEEVAFMLDEKAREYSLTIIGRNEQGQKVELGTVNGGDIAMALTDALGATEDILLQQDEWLWIKSLRGDTYSYSIQQGVVFDEDLLREKLFAVEALQAENMIAPTDAYIGEFSETEGAYELVAHTKGTTLDTEAVVAYAVAAIYGNETSVDVEELGCYAVPEVTVEDRKLLENWEKINLWLKADITYDWNGSEVKVDTSVIKEWVSLEEGKPILDEEAVAAFVEENAGQYDTYGKPRTVTTTSGVKKTLPSGAFGWKTDREAETAELISLIKKGAVTEREPVYSSKAPVKGVNDIGSSYVEADLTNQHLYLYYKGNLVMETDFVSGDMRVSGNITPQGVFGLTYKTKNAVLRGADYETPVSYWMPFHGNFGMHDATWRSEFGGDIYLTNGSHGCLNLPLDKAAELYNYLYTGYPVICYY